MSLLGELTLRLSWDNRDNLYNDFPVFQQLRVRTNISTSTSPFNGYNNFCYVSLPAYILKKEEVREKSWIFDALMFGERYIYVVKISELMNSKLNQNLDYINVFFDYKSGRLSESLSPKPSDCVNLTKIRNIEEYNEAIFHWNSHRNIIES